MVDTKTYRPCTTLINGEDEISPCWFKRVYRHYIQHGYGEQLKEVLKLTWPMVLAQVLEQLVFTLTAMFTGHLGKNQLDALALGTTAVNVTGYSLTYGINTACDTLFSQTYGSRRRKYLGILLQKALLINLFLGIVCAIFLLNMDYILILTGQDPLIARMAGQFTAMNIPGLVLSSLMLVLCKYLACQNIVRPTLLIMVVLNVLHVFFLHLFLYWFKLDITGAALALCFTYGSGMAMHVLYIYGSNVYKETWTGWSVTCLFEWKDFLRLAMYGLLMMCLSWWCTEIYMVLTGLLGKVELGTHYVALQTVAIVTMPAFGLSLAINVRIGNLIGCGDHVAARTTSRLGVTVACVVAVSTSTSVIMVGHFVPYAFTKDRDVILRFTKLVPYMALYVFVVVFRYVLGSILFGIGRQRFGAVVSFIGVYCLSLPLGVFCMFATSLGLFGTWIGLCASEIIPVIIYFIRVLRINWKQEAEIAELRTRFGLEATKHKCSKEYQLLAQEDSTDEYAEVTDGIPEGKPSDGDRVPHTLRAVIVTRVVTFCGLLVIFALGIVSHTLDIFYGNLLSKLNITSSYHE